MYNSEEERYKSFTKWPADVLINAAIFAKAGLFYTGQNFVMECFACGVKLSNWVWGRSDLGGPVERHRFARPRCPFLVNPLETGNIPRQRNLEMKGLRSAIVDSSLPKEAQENIVRSKNPLSEYRFVSQRLWSFMTWPKPHVISPEFLALAGFYYLQYEDIVECVYCGGMLLNWRRNDIPYVEHRAHFPQCDFYNRIRGHEKKEDKNLEDKEKDEQIKENEKKEKEEKEKKKKEEEEKQKRKEEEEQKRKEEEEQKRKEEEEQKRKEEEKQKRKEEEQKKKEEEEQKKKEEEEQKKKEEERKKKEEEKEHNNDLVTPTSTISNLTKTYNKLGIQQHPRPVEEKFATQQARIETFIGWPSNHTHTPEMLAAAGFYYCGYEDQVRCFHCDGGLTDWEPSDDPWVEHARWFSTCHFVNLTRGPNFVRKCIQNRQTFDPLTFHDSIEIKDETSQASNSTVSQSDNIQEERMTDAKMQMLLNSDITTAALELELPVERVTKVLKRKLENTGILYTSTENLIRDVLNDILDKKQSAERNITFTEADSSKKLIALMDNITVRNDILTNNSTPKEINDEVHSEINQKNNENEAASTTNPSEITSCEMTLKQENVRLKEARLCKICMDNEVVIVFLPCGHLATCHICAPSLQSCPICRNDIFGSVRAFLS